MESQSRYGIMQEMNQKKVNLKTELNNIEMERDKTVLQITKNIENLGNALNIRKNNYKSEYMQWNREMGVKRKLLDFEYKKRLEEIDSLIAERANSYEQEFINYEAQQKDLIAKEKNNLKEFEQSQDKLIQAKESIVKELDEGINSLKEISKESTKE